MYIQVYNLIGNMYFQGGKGITLLPEASAGAYNKVVFWFHGLGDTADGMYICIYMYICVLICQHMNMFTFRYVYI
jgi:hypothetical protein